MMIQNLSWEVQIPHSRSDDITREIDLIEEIGRLHGFNNFLTTLPKIKTIGNEDPSYQTRKKITSCLLNLGFNELIHYSLVNEKTFLNNEIKLINPLLSDCSSLRASLLPI
jgi:phenylalanyl-tRNA synthetase beta chain